MRRALAQLCVTAAVLTAAVIAFPAAAYADEPPAAAPLTFDPLPPSVDPLGPPFANAGRPFTPPYRPPTGHLGEAAWFVLTDAVDTLLTPMTWETEDWERLGFGAAIVGGAMLLDVGNYRFWRANQHAYYDKLALKLDVWGSGGRAMEFFAIGLLGSWALDQPYAMQVCGAAVSSAWVCGTIGRWGKGLSHRERPKSQGNNPDPLLFHGLPKPEVGSSSFPSGHTLGVWSWAWVIWDMVGGVPGVLAVSMATLVGVQRMYESAHWLSDVTASVLIARVVSTKVIALSQGRTIGVAIVPFDAQATGIGLRLTF